MVSCKKTNQMVNYRQSGLKTSRTMTALCVLMVGSCEGMKPRSNDEYHILRARMENIINETADKQKEKLLPLHFLNLVRYRGKARMLTVKQVKYFKKAFVTDKAKETKYATAYAIRKHILDNRVPIRKIRIAGALQSMQMEDTVGRVAREFMTATKGQEGASDWNLQSVQEELKRYVTLASVDGWLNRHKVNGKDTDVLVDFSATEEWGKDFKVHVTTKKNPKKAGLHRVILWETVEGQIKEWLESRKSKIREVIKKHFDDTERVNSADGHGMIEMMIEKTDAGILATNIMERNWNDARVKHNIVRKYFELVKNHHLKLHE